MAQWGPVQVIPAGLLGFLNIKNSGRNPESIDSNVMPVFDIMPLWMQTKAEDIGTFTSPAPSGNNGFGSWTIRQIVPEREAWFVLEYTIRTTNMGVGDSAAYAAGWQQPITQQRYLVGDLGTNNSGDGVASGFARGFWVPAGGELLWYTNDVVNATGFTLIGTARIVRFPF